MFKIDWNRRTCSRRGHTTYAPDEPELRSRLHAHTALGDAWRCLRCGDFSLGAPHGSGPADEAPLVPRGKALRDLFILRFLAVERFLRGLLIIVVAWAVWKFSNSQDAVREFFDENLTVFKPVTDHFHWDLEHSPIVDTIRKSFDFKHSTLLIVAVALLAYAVIEIVEAVGLWMGRRWAEYLTVVATAAFLPLEVYELSEHVSAVKICTLALNIIAVLWILLSKRLFGLRGGVVAFEAERHSASLLEVEQAAGTVPAAV
ncbi:DUF2127 domain-containing protein [Kitasatospora atroaurantiaca]|uniref:Uncharacterized membrane protein (DUF2068 family) n=1 Tax=Kitasatospora atroaurantiaca TaxID=285545 RepID=A0A561EVA7_9ACTN|nr:DUF2127 domain-containing protein [Kitasatospora atroaurantiaca]TWE19545.1 uncharacterized membrane protein (DUF2068 family) [Kitasatospora atroaurantiaca]